MQQKKIENLQKLLDEFPHENYSICSRVHRLRTFKEDWFVKRDDELSFSISGTKLRKYRTLIPYLKQFHQVTVTGGAFSNHVLGISQLLIENGIRPNIVLQGIPPKEAMGNYLLLQMLISPSSISWSDEAKGECVLAEGGACFPAFLGGLSLPIDIVRNEQEMGLSFDHVFIEAGTGVSAAALLLGFAYMEKKINCHVLLMADDETTFREKLKEYHRLFEIWLGDSCPFPGGFECQHPTSAASFGATNASLFKFIVEIARTEGFFLDPIYSGKLFQYAKRKVDDLIGPSLIVHSGGALTLSGFPSQLARALR